MTDPRSGQLPLESAPLFAAIRTPALVGAVVLAGFILVFFGWGAFVPLSGGAIAQGQISPEGSRRTVQHLEGGIIRQLRVRDGDIVAAGDVLVVLQETRARSGVEILQGQMRQLEAQRARLRSEQYGHESPDFPDHLEALRGDPEIDELLDVQTDLFDQRMELHRNRQSMLDQRIGQLNAEIDGMQAQIRSQRRRLELIESEIADTQSLVDRGLAPRPRLLALQREEASIEEQLAANRAGIARSRQAIGETETQLLALDSQRLDDISTELNEVQARISETGGQLQASEDVLRRTRITAPISGTVVNLRFHTEGGVIRPGDPVLDIVPDEEALIISARLAPVHIDAVAPGQSAIVHLTALEQRTLPRIEGEVISVSADAIVDADTGESYFQVRVRVDMAVLDTLSEQTGEELRLVPGMPAGVLIVTGERTMLAYLTAPLRKSFRNALREA